jgi:hypothetical protein
VGVSLRLPFQGGIMIRLPLITLVVSILVTQTLLAFERPVISLGSPHGLDEEGMPVRYASTSNMSVMGEIKPPVGDSVAVRVYHVFGDGQLRRLAGATSQVRDGKFMLEIDSPEGGWKEGRLRIEVSLSGLPQVKSSVDVTVVRRAVADADAPGGFRPPGDSEIVLDYVKSRGTTARVPANKMFYIRGEFECEGIESKFEGPKVTGSLDKEPIDGKGKVTYQSSSSLSIRMAENKPRFGYEIQILAPNKPGVFGVRVTPHVGMWLGELEREKPDFFIEVTEPEK